MRKKYTHADKGGAFQSKIMLFGDYHKRCLLFLEVLIKSHLYWCNLAYILRVKMRTFFFIGAIAAFADLTANAIDINQVSSVPEISSNFGQIDADVPIVANADAETDKKQAAAGSKTAGKTVCDAAKKTSKECDEAAAEKERERKK